MEMFKHVWHLRKLNSRQFWLVIGYAIILGVVGGNLVNIVENLTGGSLGAVWTIVSLIWNLVFQYYTFLTTLMLFKETVLANRETSMTDLFKTGFAFFKKYWKEGLKPYILWYLLAQAVVTIFSGLLIAIAAVITLGPSVTSQAASLLDASMPLNRIQGLSGGLPLIALILFCVIGCLTVLFSLAVQLMAQGKAAQAALYHKNEKIPFSTCLKLAVPLALVTGIFFLVIFACVAFAPVLLGVTILILLVAVIFFVWFAIVYDYCAELAILQEAAGHNPVEELDPGYLIPDQENLPDLPTK